MRGGLDDALDKLARRDELRRRASGETTGTPAAVTELVEAIVAVVARHPKLGVTVGVEGVGDPLLLRFFLEDGVVQVNADTPVPAPAAEAAPRHADFDIEAEEPPEEPYQASPAYPAAEDDGGVTQRLSRDDQDRYGPASYGHEQDTTTYFAESDTAERRYGSFDGPSAAHDPGHRAGERGETSHDLGARMRDLGMASRDTAPHQPYPPHPFAAAPPPPIPPQTTRRINPEQYRAPAEPSAAERIPLQQQPPQQPPQARAQQQPPEMRGMPAPLPTPIPLQVERPEQTEMAVRRLAALLRDDPSLLNQAPD